jgi:hypothetical protein
MISSTPALRATSSLSKHVYQNSVARVGANFVGWSIVFSAFMGWPLLVQAYEYKVYGKKQ